MKSSSLWLAVVGLSLLAASASAVNRYVDLNSTNPVPPYSSWATAATNIQDAIDYPDVGPFAVFVTNGIYQTGITTNNGLNRVTLRNSAILVQSINGPAVTVIKGYQVPGTTNGAGSVRCVYIGSGATLSGFTLTNGSMTGSGGGVYCTSPNSIVTNCVIVGNSARDFGAGGYLGSYLNCRICGNTSFSNGGGIYSGTATNCLIVGNAAQNGGGTYGNLSVNCTIVGNSASVAGGGFYAGAGSGYLYNCVVYYNSAPNGYNYILAKLVYCCTIPFSDTGCITNAPLFVAQAHGDFHLQAGSPCINAGTNSYVIGGTDLDGNPRIMGGTVDMGAYEFQAPIRYVNLNNTAPVSPFTNWVTAATNIQDAVDVANAGDFIVASNGIYNYGGRAVYGIATNRVTVNKAVTLTSLNGPIATMIAGFTTMANDYQIRCVYLTNGAVLAGFTLTNGACRHSGDAIQEQSGGGVWCEGSGAIVSNCLFSGNQAVSYGGGAFRGTLLSCVLTNNYGGFGGAAGSNTLMNCGLLRNTANQQNYNSGGGAYYCTLSNCVLVGNVCYGGRGGGGAYASTLTSCTISNNFANRSYGGGVYLGTASDSLISSNSSLGYGGGACSNTLINCVLRNNLATGGGGAYFSALLGSTVVSNNASQWGGGVYGGTLTNCIVYYNSAPKSPNVQLDPDTAISYCDTTPMITNGIGNITNDPAFVNLAAGDYHLQSNSPCINAGYNAAAPGGPDLDGNPRIVGGTVDIGAYENQSPALLAYFTWLQSYGLPTDAADVYTDSDGDGMNNWQEWIAGTDPTNPSSLLKMTRVTNAVSGLTVTWQSVSGKTYFLQRSGDLTSQPAFSTIQSNIVGQAGATSYIDTSAIGSGPFFYRVGIQQ